MKNFAIAILALWRNNRSFPFAISTSVIRDTFLVDGSVQIVKTNFYGSIRSYQTPFQPVISHSQESEYHNDVFSDYSEISFPKSDNWIPDFHMYIINYEPSDATQSAIFNLLSSKRITIHQYRFLLDMLFSPFPFLSEY